MERSHALSKSLKTTWKQYEDKVHLAKDSQSSKNIHQLRISTQKLEAILTLINSINLTHGSNSIVYLIKKVRKSLGPLRDLQVEATAFSRLNEQKLKGEKLNLFSKFFNLQKVKAQKKAAHSLEDISLKHDKIRVLKLAQKLSLIESKKNKYKIQDQMDHQLKKTVIKINKDLKKINPCEVKQIHKFRIKVKKLRYQQECLNSLPDRLLIDFENIKDVQDIAGRIQNETVLIKTLDKFLSKKKNCEDQKIIKFREDLVISQAKHIKKDFSKITPFEWAT
ncbi:MAG: CHAD domain-containing protein [Bdellovibrio sp.]|nr:CHAD domain-containing protein [Bdellovibrio sp.]